MTTQTTGPSDLSRPRSRHVCRFGNLLRSVSSAIGRPVGLQAAEVGRPVGSQAAEVETLQFAAACCQYGIAAVSRSALGCLYCSTGLAH
mmetsp:Transcript_9485/g.30331  ORF Transcript_9485/g.30331 Transcript_9485/m.30331 type:complete len:89 (-) Transcript_9485:205-471(-)